MTYWVGSLCGSIPTLPPPTLPLPPQSPSLTPAASDLPSLLPQPLPTLLLCRRPGERCGPPRGPTSCQGSMALDSGWEGPTWARRCSRYSRWAAVGGGRWCVTMACERQADSRRVMRPSWRIRGGRQGSNRFSVCRRLWGSSFGLTPPPRPFCMGSGRSGGAALCAGSSDGPTSSSPWPS